MRNKHNQIKNWTGKVILHVDINSFYSSCEEIRNTSLKGKQHAVIMTNQTFGNITKGVVATCSYEAKRLGVQSGMPLYKALELCPNLILLTVDKSYYNKMSELIMKIIEGFSDSFEQASIDEAFLDCTAKISSSNLTIEEYAKQIKKTIQESCGGLLTSIGVSTSKSVAKIASDYQKPDGLIIVSKEKINKFLYPLEVERISGIGVKTQKILKGEMKIKTIGQLAETDVQILIEKFGRKTGTWMWQVSNGEDNEPVIPRDDHISLSNESTLNNFTQDREEIKKCLHELVDELFERVINNDYQFRTVAIKLVRTDFRIETRETSYTNYQKNRKSIESVIDDLLDKFIFGNELSDTDKIIDSNKKILTVRKVGLKVSNLIRDKNRRNTRSRQKTLLEYID
ncbi:MAG: DNA polymerase IV [Nitrososphaeraceae archaeon]